MTDKLTPLLVIETLPGEPVIEWMWWDEPFGVRESPRDPKRVLRTFDAYRLDTRVLAAEITWSSTKRRYEIVSVGTELAPAEIAVLEGFVTQITKSRADWAARGII